MQLENAFPIHMTDKKPQCIVLKPPPQILPHDKNDDDDDEQEGI